MIERQIQLPELSELEFDEEAHIYRLRGEEVPSVTQLLKLLPDNDYANIPEAVLYNAARRGTAVHEAIEYYTLYGIEEYSEECEPYMAAFKAFWEGFGGTVLGSEVRIYNDCDTDEERELYGTAYAGTLDLLAARDDKIVLMDFKCTSKILKKKYALQLEAYARALKKFGIPVDEKIVVQLKKDGKFRAVDFPAVDEYSWAVFRGLRAINHF